MGMETGVLKGDLSSLFEKHALLDAVFDLNNISSGRLFNPVWKFTDKASRFQHFSPEILTCRGVQLDGTQRRFKKAQDEYLNVITAMIEKRTHELETGAAVKGDDFLSTLLSDSGDKDPLLIRDTLITLLFASRDNTQNSFTWALYELSNHPEWMDKMRAEAIALAPSRGNVVSFANIGVSLSSLFSYNLISLLAIRRRILFIWPYFMRRCAFGLVFPRTPDSRSKTTSFPPFQNTDSPLSKFNAATMFCGQTGQWGVTPR